MVLFRHIPLAGSGRAVDVHLKGYRLFRPIQCLNQYARDFKYEHCGSLWNQGHHLSIQQATCKRASPYLSQLDSLDYCHARKIESAWDNSDLEDTDPPPQVLCCLGLQKPGSGQSLKHAGHLDTWMWAMPAITFSTQPASQRSLSCRDLWCHCAHLVQPMNL